MKLFFQENFKWSTVCDQLDNRNLFKIAPNMNMKFKVYCYLNSEPFVRMKSHCQHASFSGKVYFESKLGCVDNMGVDEGD
jgi:hypothetical protein